MTQSIRWALASVHSGLVIQRGQDDHVSQEVAELAAVLPEVYGTSDSGLLERISARLGVEETGAACAEVLLLSYDRAYVLRPLARRPGQALVATSPGGSRLGLLLSQVHARASALDEEA